MATNYQISSDTLTGFADEARRLNGGSTEPLTTGEMLTVFRSTSAGGTGVSVQPDYAQNDSTASDYIKNRPFYSEIESTILENTSIELDDTGFGKFVFSISDHVGESVVVRINDEEHIAEIGKIEVEEGALGLILIGNGYIFLEAMSGLFGSVEAIVEEYPAFAPLNKDTGESFIIYNDNDTECSIIIRDIASQTINLIIDKLFIKKIDNYFVDSPNGLPEVSSANDGQILGVVGGTWVNTSAPSSLPEVTTDDNDKVLTVVDGAWVASSIANGDEVSY